MLLCFLALILESLETENCSVNSLHRILHSFAKQTVSTVPPKQKDRPTTWVGEKTTIALRTEDSSLVAAIDDVTVAARWGDSACSFVLDLAGLGAHYALPADIALAKGNSKASRAKLENPDQVLAEETGESTTLCPLRLASGTAVWRVRVLMRARSFWLVSYLTTGPGGANNGACRALPPLCLAVSLVSLCVCVCVCVCVYLGLSLSLSPPPPPHPRAHARPVIPHPRLSSPRGEQISGRWRLERSIGPLTCQLWFGR